MGDLRIISRVARRVQAAGVPVGKSFYTGKDSTIVVTRYSGILKIRDLTLAGKRGKSVPEISIILNENYYKGDPEEWFENVMDQLAKCDTWSEVQEVAKDLVKENEGPWADAVVLREQNLKAIDVAPAGTEIKFKTLTGLEISASPIDFHVTHRAMIGRVEGDPRKPGFAQDTGYWPAKKRDAAIFYAYLKDNMSKIMKMTIRDLTEVWGSLGVHYDSH
jgi:hypothetical protein